MTNNLFLAVYPDAAALAPIEQCAIDLNQRHELVGNLRPPELLHVTVVPFADLRDPPREIAEKAIAAGQRIAMPAFDVAFDQVLSFPVDKNRYALVLAGGDGAAGLVALQRALIAGLHKQWLKVPPDIGYKPHMTLAYSRQSLAVQTIPAISWRVQGFALIHSHAGQSRHEVIARWPLSGV